MNRGFKKTIYGAFYLLVVAGVCVLFISARPNVSPTCNDGIRNQDEEDVDCGGPHCITCAVQRAAPLYIEGRVQTFHASTGKTVFFAEVVNPNAFVGATRFSYRFIVYDQFGTAIETIPGTDSIAPSERRYIFIPNVAHTFNEIERVSLELDPLSEDAWSVAQYFSRPIVIATRTSLSATDDGNVFVDGVVRNQGPVSASNVAIIAVLFDEYNSPLIASQTIIPSLESLDETSFTVIFPRDEAYISRINQASLKIFINAQ